MIDLESNVQHWINRLSFMLRAEAQTRLKAAGLNLTAEEWALLMVLWRDGPTQMAALAAITLRDRTTVTRLVDRLIKKGLVQRTSSKTDRRQVIIEVTKTGTQMMPPAMATLAPLIEKSSAGISAHELSITMDVLRRMAKNLES